MRFPNYHRCFCHAGSLLFERLNGLVAAGDLSTYARAKEGSTFSYHHGVERHKANVVLGLSLLIAMLLSVSSLLRDLVELRHGGSRSTSTKFRSINVYRLSL